MGLAGLCYSAQSETTSIVNEVMTYSRNIDKDVGGAEGVSVQVVYSSASPTTVTFTDGKISTGSITINSYAVLSSSQAMNTLQVASNTALSGHWIRLNNIQITEGVEWTKSTTATGTAISIAAAINSKGGLIGAVTASTTNITAGYVKFVAVNYGSSGNAYTLETSTPAGLVRGGAIFYSGIDNAVLTFGDKRLIAGTHFTPATSNAVTAKSLSDAIMADPSMSMVIKSTWSAAGVVTATSTVAGEFGNFILVSSTSPAMAVFASKMYGGTNPDIVLDTPTLSGFNFSTTYQYPGNNIVKNSISKSATQWGTGLPLLLGVTAGTAPSPLVNKTTYYTMNVQANSFQLARTSTDSVAGNNIVITTMTQAGSGTFTLTPIAIAGTPVFKIQGSNNGSTFSDLYISSMTSMYSFSSVNSSPCSVSFASPYTASSAMWNLGNIYFKVLRLVFTTGTWGGVNINTIVNSR